MLRLTPRRSSRSLRAKPLFGCMTATGLVLVLASCTNIDPQLPPVLEVPKANLSSGELLVAGDESKRTALGSAPGLSPPVGRTLAEPFSSATPPKLTGENIGVNFEGLRLPAFVNTVFGELLKVSFVIDDPVVKRDQLITLRTAEPIPPDQFYRLVTEVLATYGLQVVYQNNVYRIVEGAAVRPDVPTIVRSRSLSSVPGDQRPIFFFTPIHNVQSASMQGWLELALRDRVRFQPVGNANGLLLMGRREDINAALETIEILDQPNMAGNRSLKIMPAFWSAGRLAEQLVQVMTAEGYSIGVGTSSAVAVRMVPIEALNTVIVFSTSEQTLQHLLEWATELDQPSQSINAQSMFYYQVQNASAAKVADLVGSVLGGGVGGITGNESPAQRQQIQQGQANSPAAAAMQTTTPAARQKLTVDETRNAIIFQGSAEEWAQFRGLMVQMDRPPLEVLIEATVAEVTLDKTESLGVILGFDDGLPDLPNRNTIRSTSGLIATLLRSNGQINASVNALATNSRVTVLSTPRLVTTSGQAASIQVGSQVPIVTTQQTAPNGAIGGTSNILQDVQYRTTGILLNIKPTINSSRRIELTISQEVSSAAINDVSNIDSPIIQQRSIQTTLSIADGETALLGGLTTNNANTGSNGVPYLKDIPILGSLFKNESINTTRTELIIMLTPYIIDGPEQSRAVLDAFKNRLGEWARDVPVVKVDEKNQPGEVMIKNRPE